MKILKDINELVQAGVISNKEAGNIRDYYRDKGELSNNRLFIVFGILGAILVGLGFILIIAHNWDEISKIAKTSFAFLPLLLGQILCGFTLIKKRDSVVWKEGTTAFLFFAVGAVISLVSQIYNIPGNLGSFLLLWMLLCLPLIYIMRSSVASLLYLIGITYYACETGYWSFHSAGTYLYWLLLLGVLPHYYHLYTKKSGSNFMTFHNWIITLSIVISLGTVTDRTGELMYISYFSLFGLFSLMGKSQFFDLQNTRNNAYKIVGSLGTIGLLLALSFDWFWMELRTGDLMYTYAIGSPEFFAAVILTLSAGVLLFFQQVKINLTDFVFALFVPIFFLGQVSIIAVVLINVLVFMIGIFKIIEGVKKDHLGIVNYGLLIITALIVCRFFDTDLSFIFRGILFVLVGVGFFLTNYRMLKKRKTND
jgi:uncharacterized membrane protein